MEGMPSKIGKIGLIVIEFEEFFKK